MRAFSYQKVKTPVEAAKAVADSPNAKFIAGGTNLLDLMKLDIERPRHLVDVNGLGLDKVETMPDGSLKVGALVRNADLANHPQVKKHYAVLSRAILAGASAQIRNRATTAGNLLQRSRCPYFYDRSRPCNKRVPGSGCAAIGGLSRDMAILGVSSHCISQNPSDMSVAMRLLDAKISTVRPDGQTRVIPIADFHLVPGSSPQIETPLSEGELITSVMLPPPIGGFQTYRKVRDRASFAFATISIAAVIGKDFQRFAFGGLASKPWRVESAEALTGAHAIASHVLAGAQPTRQNAFKQKLTYRTLAATLAEARS